MAWTLEPCHANHDAPPGLEVARKALGAARESLPAYARTTAPHLFTQHQLFAILVVREFLWLDCRTVVERHHAKVAP